MPVTTLCGKDILSYVDIMINVAVTVDFSMAFLPILREIQQYLTLVIFFFFLYGAAAHIGPWPPLYEVP
jgi:hypothetical protein